MSLAARQLIITLECLNFFGDVIPYNRHRPRIGSAPVPSSLRIGESGPAIALQMAVATDGSFWQSRHATKAGTFSLERIRELTGSAGEAVKRVETLLSQEVEESGRGALAARCAVDGTSYER